MNSKSVLIKALLASLILANTLVVSAQGAGLKVAVVKGAIGSQSIIAGDIETGLKKLSRRSFNEGAFNKKMGLCVAYLKSENIDKSENACTAAVEASKLINSTNQNALYLKSLSYSNRGVARYLKDDLTGAIDDLTMAKSIDANTVTVGNLKFVEDINTDITDDYSQKLSD